MHTIIKLSTFSKQPFQALKVFAIQTIRPLHARGDDNKAISWLMRRLGISGFEKCMFFLGLQGE